MSNMISSFFDRLTYRRAFSFWSKAARRAKKTDLSSLRTQQQQAYRLRGQLDELTHVADNRLGFPRVGSSAFPRPGGTDWAWRPQLWRGGLGQKGIAGAENRTELGDEITLFHDCKISELTLRQLRNSHQTDLAPYGLRMDVFRFDGSFLSLAIDLPQDACTGLEKRHIIKLNTIIETEKDIEIFGRLNVKHGPNTEQIVREIPLGGAETSAEFDLGYSDINEKRIERVWLDLIFESPEMNQVTIRDATLCRFPRAEI